MISLSYSWGALPRVTQALPKKRGADLVDEGLRAGAAQAVVSVEGVDVVGRRVLKGYQSTAQSPC